MIIVIHWQAGILTVKLNKGGLTLSAIYLAYFVIVFGISLTAGDPKGEFFLVQLAYLPAGLFLGLSGLMSLLEKASVGSWINGPLLFLPLSLVIVYVFGWIMHVIISAKDPTEPIGEDTADWHKR